MYSNSAGLPIIAAIIIKGHLFTVVINVSKCHKPRQVSMKATSQCKQAWCSN